jgi:penicillin-binding protein 1A
LILISVLLLSGAYGFYRVTRNLPQITSLKDYQPSIVTTVYADDDSLIAEFYLERRIVVPLEQIPQILVEAFVSAEDSRFFEHEGIDSSVYFVPCGKTSRHAALSRAGAP